MIATVLRTSIVTALAFATLAGAAPAARADQDPVLEEVARTAPMVRFWGDEVSVNARWDELIRGDEGVDACLAAIAAAHAKGFQPRQEVALTQGSSHVPTTRTEPHPQGGTSIAFSTLGRLKEFCAGKRAKVQLVRAYLAVRDAQYQLDRLARIDNIDRLAYASMTARMCRSEVVRALAMKNPPAVAFQRPDVTLGQAEAAICGALDGGLAKIRDGMRQQADLKGFHAALSGDRRKLFDEHLLFAAPVFGESRYPLATPDDFTSLDDWYLVEPDRDKFGMEAWRVTLFHLEGDKLAATDVRRGAGHEPPKDAFAPFQAKPTAAPGLE